MCAIDDKRVEENASAGAALGVRIEVVDNWHSAWPRVLRFVEKHGDAKKLQVDDDGWLSARQVLIAAMAGDQIAAHVSFSVAPGRTCIEAKLDDYGIAPKFCDRGIESKLRRAALERAESLGCEKLRGFKVNANWC